MLDANKINILSKYKKKLIEMNFSNFDRVDKKEVEEFFNVVKSMMGLDDWEMDWTPENDAPECYWDIKRIGIPTGFLKKSVWVIKQTILHEVAHALDDTRNLSGRNCHDKRKFWEIFGKLVKIFMPVVEDK